MRRSVFLLFLLVLFASSGYSQDKTPELSGQVTDPAGYIIPGATVAITPESSKSAQPGHISTSDSAGKYRFSNLTPGNYTLTVEASGFAAYRQEHLAVLPNANPNLNIKLQIATQQEEVTVSDDDSNSLTDPDNNATGVVLKNRDLDLMPDDSTLMLQQLQAMAGGSDAELFVDGYSGGSLPPKDTIREIRINQNPYSAKNDTDPYAGMIEVFTKPGSDKIHGGFSSYGNDSPFNTNSRFAEQQPGYYFYTWNANVSGPLSKHASYFLNGGQSRESTNSIIVATDPITFDPLKQTVPTVSSGFNISPRLDFQIGTSSTVSMRYQFSRNTQTNGGVGGFTLPSEGTNSTSESQLLQVSNSQAFGKKVVNDTRFQLSRSDSNTTPYSTDTTIIVNGVFNGGGSPAGQSKNSTENYELQNYVYVVAGKNYLNFGMRLRAYHEDSFSKANFNGEYLFPTLAAYQSASPSQFTLTTGNPSVSATAGDIGVFYQDDWKVTPTLTLSYGLRYEAQSKVTGQDWGPRFGFSWGIGAKGKRPPQFVIGGGAGIFYRRFPNADILNARRENGVNQQTYIVSSPNFYPSIPDPSTLQAQVPSSIYQIDPHLKAESTPVFQINVSHPIIGKGKNGNFRIDALYARGVHDGLIRNINAPLPGTYNPADPTSGIRPYGGTQNINEYEAGGSSYYFRLQPGITLITKRYSLFGSYELIYAQTDTTAGTFPSNGYDLKADRGRPNLGFDARNQLTIGSSANLPFGFTSSLFLNTHSGLPFNIVVGQDLNGDSQYNDRPSFATDLSRPSVVVTRYGTFDTSPIAGQKIIPINYGRSPSFIDVEFNLGRTWTFGSSSKPAPSMPNASKGAPKLPGKYSLNLSATADNVLNHVNLAPPVGTIGTPYFGQSIATVGSFIPSANRAVLLQLRFNF